MTPTNRPTVLDVSDLVGRPGADRALQATFPAPEGMVLEVARVEGEVQLDGLLESLVDGVLARGTLHAHLAMVCARCLTELGRDVTQHVAELYSDPARAENPDGIEPGYVIHGDRIDLDTLLRDTLAESVPVAPHCRDDCKGLCPSCGVDRNVTTCVCTDEAPDPRWSALAGLRLDEG